MTEAFSIAISCPRPEIEGARDKGVHSFLYYKVKPRSKVIKRNI